MAERKKETLQAYIGKIISKLEKKIDITTCKQDLNIPFIEELQQGKKAYRIAAFYNMCVFLNKQPDEKVMFKPMISAIARDKNPSHLLEYIGLVIDYFAGPGHQKYMDDENFYQRITAGLCPYMKYGNNTTEFDKKNAAFYFTLLSPLLNVSNMNNIINVFEQSNITVYDKDLISELKLNDPHKNRDDLKTLLGSLIINLGGYNFYFCRAQLLNAFKSLKITSCIEDGNLTNNCDPDDDCYYSGKGKYGVCIEDKYVQGSSAVIDGRKFVGPPNVIDELKKKFNVQEDIVIVDDEKEHIKKPKKDRNDDVDDDSESSEMSEDSDKTLHNIRQCLKNIAGQ